MTTPPPIDALRSCPAGRYDDGLVVVTAGARDGHERAAGPAGAERIDHPLSCILPAVVAC